MRELHVAGTGSFALEVVEYALADGYRVAGLLELIDPARAGRQVHGLPVLAGLGLQLVVGAAALWLARSLMRAADHLGWSLARRTVRTRRAPSGTGGWPLELVPVRVPVLASREAGRAPPAPA